MSSFHSAFRTPHSTLLLLALVLASGLSSVAPSACRAQDDPFAAGVRTTPWLSPADEQKAFQLPPGFEIQLVAAEPDIQKPLNMAFDERGRIWLTCTVEYPYAAPLDRPGRDSIRILEDTDGDGRFEKMTLFADGLNIPIGIYPWKGGCVAYSIPDITHFEDTDGDGRCDKRTKLYGPFDHTRDTHGMVNSFRRGFDGWIYACHGFNNDSRVKGRDGHEVHMQSGNTFRFKLDGSRIEHFTHGQVNPFGMCFDELFNIFTADCHSKPLTQLIRGGYYPSFGRPHDGLGFVPSMMEHSHGSTAICGVVKYSGENFPAEYRGDFYSGNVMTSRINRNKLEYHGSTIRAIEQPDFLSTTDPWFRPVDLQIGPDGALYILDFYNRIIGHYEVPLPHPGRDRTSGRIWRVVYVGDDPATKSAQMPEDMTKDIDSTMRGLVNPNLEHRLRAQHYVMDHFLGDWGKMKMRSIPFNNRQGMAHYRWMQRLITTDSPSAAGLQNRLIELMAKKDVGGLPIIPNELQKVHELKLLTEDSQWSGENSRRALTDLLSDKSGFVVKAAAQLLAQRPDKAQIRPLLARLNSTTGDDPQLRYVLRQSLRDHVAALDDATAIDMQRLSAADRNELASICLATTSEVGASLLISHLESTDAPREGLVEYVQHAARYARGEKVDRLITYARASFGKDLLLQANVAQALVAGLDQRGKDDAPESLRQWATTTASDLLEPSRIDSLGWTAVPVEGKPASENPWVIAARPCADGVNDRPFYYSLPKGEQRTGIYRSAAFEIPAKLSFWCAGHSGFPGHPLNEGNYVRLRDAASHAVLAESRPPRNDVARRFEWDLKAHAGKRGYVELQDGDTANAYAWLAVGRFSLAALNPNDTARKQQLAAEIVGKLKLASLRPQLAALVAAPSTDGAARAAIGLALVSLDPDSRAAALVASLNDPAIPNDLRVAIGTTLTRRAREGMPGETTRLYLDNLREVMKRAPSRLQTLIAETLAGDAAGADALLTLAEAGHASPRLLLAPNVSAKFGTLKSEELDKRVVALTSKLPPASETLDRLILERRVAFAKATPNLERGAAVFEKHCAACHQIAGQGSVVGPQLDGIGSRGLERIIEDVLDPNRNVDVAFRTTTMRLTDGRVVSGLFRRAEGSQLVFADNQGKEFTLAKDEIDEEAKTALSLMPANVPEIVSPEEFHDLVGYLLGQRHVQK